MALHFPAAKKVKEVTEVRGTEWDRSVYLGWRERLLPSLLTGTRMTWGTNYEVSAPVRTGSDILAASTACSLLQLLSELHSWGEDSNLLLGLRAQGFSSSASNSAGLSLLEGGEGEGKQGRRGLGGKRGKGRDILVEQLIIMPDESACLLVVHWGKISCQLFMGEKLSSLKVNFVNSLGGADKMGVLGAMRLLDKRPSIGSPLYSASPRPAVHGDLPEASGRNAPWHGRTGTFISVEPRL